MTKDTQIKRYNFVAMLLHWLIFAMLVREIMIGWSLEDLPKAEKFIAIQQHKSIGLTILLLSVLRLVWRIINPPPALPESMSAKDIKITKMVHHSFYLLMIGIPLIGWVMISSYSAKIPTMFWGLFEWPTLPLSELPFSHAMHEVTEFMHSKLVWLGIILVVLHVLAALKHQFIDKDGLLKRMIPFI